MKSYFNALKAAVEEELQSLDWTKGRTAEAAGYYLLAPGKRLRPVLLLHFAEGAPEAVTFAAALEMIHNYSLIHDDLPALDNDDRRRDLPSCHKAYGEDFAILAGDALLNTAYEQMLGAVVRHPQHTAKAAAWIARMAGRDGMIFGQEKDLLGDEKVLETAYYKTAHLFMAACGAGAYLHEDPEDKVKAAIRFGMLFGLSLQLHDDLSDYARDCAQGVRTYPVQYGKEKTRALLDCIEKEMFEIIEKRQDDFLSELTRFMIGAFDEA